ncbi:hypothetical protein CRN15_00025 [Raoultella planticola]|uniref:hypothetical protein n=1 Tax=Raoultella planticola TaxID=575 RepID=UPI000BFC4FCB|nr:hypothetical protein [Raoultella planticola]ATM04490.1 hypothetical protein CRT62_07595 [Raoultella planticola]ATM13352.1 hypothetical protein CRN15_00025 [Raoultella planticola]PHH26703.1 hypothetical protein CRX55_22900 [Raoultella planticola]HED2620933.1 hypothetical protein [Raoultella planticola]
MADEKLSKTIWEEKEMPSLEYCSITRAAELLNYNEEDFLHWHDQGLITLSVNLHEDVPAFIVFESNTALFETIDPVIQKAYIDEENDGRKRGILIEENGSKRVIISEGNNEGLIFINKNEREKINSKLDKNKSIMENLIHNIFYKHSGIVLPNGHIKVITTNTNEHTLKNEIYGCYIYGIWEISDERDLTNDMNSTSGIFPFELKPKLIINNEIHNVTATSDEFGGFTQKDFFLTKSDVEKIFQRGRLPHLTQQEKSNLIEKPIDTPEKTHGNSIRNEALRMELITTAEIFLKKFPEKCKSRRLLISPEEWAKAIIQYRDNTNPDPDIPKFFMWTERTIIKHLRSYLKTRNYIVNKL